MEFEEMQTIWNSETQEKLYVINESALYQHIKAKGKKVNRLLGFVDVVMIVINLIVGIVLIVDARLDNAGTGQFVLATLYLAYSLFALLRRVTRRQQEVHFPETMVGELDKAVWQTDYLINQGRYIFFWYGLPLFVVAAFLLFPESPLWAAGLLLVLLPVTYFAGRWEINKFYRPKKRELEHLRAQIIADSPT